MAYIARDISSPARLSMQTLIWWRYQVLWGIAPWVQRQISIFTLFRMQMPERVKLLLRFLISAEKKKPEKMVRKKIEQVRTSKIYRKMDKFLNNGQIMDKVGPGRKRKSVKPLYKRLHGHAIWSEWRDLNPRPLPPQGSALPTAPHPDKQVYRLLFKYYIIDDRKSQELLRKFTHCPILRLHILKKQAIMHNKKNV